MKIEPATIKAGTNVAVSVTVTNIGERDADEVREQSILGYVWERITSLIHYLELVQFNPQVTQVYIKWDDSVSAAPIRQLVGTKRSFIKQTTDNVKKVCTYLSVSSLTHLLISVSLSLASVHHHSRTNASLDNEVGNSFWRNVCICRRTTA